MKEMLDPNIKKDQIISVEDSSSDDEEDKISKLLEATLNQVLNDIDQSLRNVLDLFPKNCPYNFNDEELDENTTSSISKIEMGESSKRKKNFNEESVIDFNEENIANEYSEDVMKEFERDKQKIEIDHFRFQNEHWNQINDGLIKANRS